MKITANKKSGISLIALMVTIVVMIMLALTVISAIDNGGVITGVDESKEEIELANVRELVSSCFAKWARMSRTEKVDNGGTFSAYATSKLDEAGYKTVGERAYIVTENAEIYRYPVIPEGFVVSPYERENDILDGLVIYETTSLSGVTKEVAMETYNQYVWIPVPNIVRFVTRDGYSNGALQDWVSSGKATEPFKKTSTSVTEDLEIEHEEYSKMRKSVEKYGGFYIARYEAGDGDATQLDTARTGVTVAKTVVSRKNSHVYNYVPWGAGMTNVGTATIDGVENVAGAVQLSRSIYPKDGSYRVVSHLIYGVEWDAVMKFMEDVENIKSPTKKYIVDSTNMGWYSANYKTGNLERKTGINVDNNASNMVKNIYDMAGNVWEWTMEVYLENTLGTNRVYRGGDTVFWGAGAPASYRKNNSIIQIAETIGFRVALYIK